MTGAYNRIYLEKAMIALGRMLDYAVYELKLDLDVFWNQFLNSPVAKRFEVGEVSTVAGRSGVELALIVCNIEKDYPEPVYTMERSKEYWLGWALAYFQWQSCLSFRQITKSMPMSKLLLMYSPYHEMDIQHFCDRMTEILDEYKCAEQKHKGQER